MAPDGHERQTCDAHAAHRSPRANDSGRCIGCIRLILPNPQDPATLFPFAKTCAATIDRAIVDPAKIDRTRVAEVPRLAVASAYRRRKSDREAAGSISQEDSARPSAPASPTCR